MHTFRGPHGTVFHFNSDFSGVQFTVPLGCVGGYRDKADVAVPGTDLLAFVAEYVRRQRIAALEQMSEAELLGLPPDHPPRREGPDGTPG